MTATAKIGKKDIKDIDQQILLLARECKKAEFPRAERWRRNGCGLPLTGWMASVKQGSKILAVSSSKAGFAYAAYKDASIAIAKRIARKKQLTSIQYQLVYEHVQSRYRGHSDWGICIPPEVLDLGPSTLERELYALLGDEFSKQHLPLNFLLSQRLTDLLLLKALFKTVKGN